MLMLQELSNELISLRRRGEGEGEGGRERESERDRDRKGGGRKEVEEQTIRLNNNGACFNYCF